MGEAGPKSARDFWMGCRSPEGNILGIFAGTNTGVCVGCVCDVKELTARPWEHDIQ